jgi:hypothetical protein
MDATEPPSLSPFPVFPALFVQVIHVPVFFWRVPGFFCRFAQPNCNWGAEGSSRSTLRDRTTFEMRLDKEWFAMRTPISRIVGPPRSFPAERRFHGVRTPGGEDSPYSPYLRYWLAHRAAQHRELLRNIDAAARLALTSSPLAH